jgi:hypothetical protein
LASLNPDAILDLEEVVRVSLAFGAKEDVAGVIVGANSSRPMTDIVVLACGLLALAAVRDPDGVQTDTVPSTPPSTNPAATSPLLPVDSSPPTLPATTTPTPSTQPSLESDPSSWPTYKSTRYHFTVGHPPDWTEVPSSRDWGWGTDIQDLGSAAHEAFVSPDDAVRVSAWNAPFGASRPEESTTGLVAWVEDYCEQSGNSPCDGIADRAVELCLEKWDCHPGLLVPFENDVQAFFSGGIYSSEAMTIVAVWQRESAPSVAPYGGAQRLLESFLATMDVWPATTPVAERDLGV